MCTVQQVEARDQQMEIKMIGKKVCFSINFYTNVVDEYIVFFPTVMSRS